MNCIVSLLVLYVIIGSIDELAFHEAQASRRWHEMAEFLIRINMEYLLVCMRESSNSS